MTRFNFGKNFALTCKSIAENKSSSALLFAALLIVCSVAVGCSSEKPQPVAVNSAPAAPTPALPAMSNPSAQAVEPPKPAPKKIVHKRPPTVTYADKTYGVSFDYPRKYAIETGDAASELIATSPLPMNFLQPGGTALAAVELPETSFPSTDFDSAFFDVSVNKTLTADQCEQFTVPRPKPSDPAATSPQPSKLMIGDMELHGAEAVAGEGPRQSDSKYFHVFQNGACYEFALNVTTNASQIEAGMKHVDRDKVFARLANILSTVKITEVAAPEVTATVPSASPASTEAPGSGTTEQAPSTSEVSKQETSKAVAASDAADSAPAAPANPSAPATPAAQAVPDASPQ
jgi:hypothetical protein